MGSNMLTPQFDSSLSFLTSPIANYFNSVPPYNNVMLEALIITPPPNPPRLLLLQKMEGSDPHAFSEYWQAPSGKPAVSDPTILAALTRIMLQQTGLRLSYVTAILGMEENPDVPESGNMRSMRMTLIVEAADFGIGTGSIDVKAMTPTPEYFVGSQDSETIDAQESQLDRVEVNIDPRTHRSHVWASESDLQEFITTGLYPVEEKTSYQIMLEAFAFYRQDFACLQSLRHSRQQTRV